MKKSGVLTLAIMLVGVIFAFTSCDRTTSTEFEESFQKVKEVTPIVGAQNVTMDLAYGESKGQDSYFVVDLGNGISKEGWCIEWNEESIQGIQAGTKLYSTQGQEAWKELNYFMSIKNDLKASDPELTFREIQVIIWSLIDNPSFDVDKISTYENISERIYKDGEPLFDVQKVKDIVSQVNNHFASAKSKTEDDYDGNIVIQNEGQTILTSSGALSFVAFYTGCEETVTDWNTDGGGSFDYEVETNFMQTTGSIKFEAEGDQLGEDGVVETDTFQFTIACETSTVTVETKNKDMDSHTFTFTPGEEHVMNNGFTVEWISRVDNGNGTYTYTFTVTSDDIDGGEED